MNKELILWAAYGIVALIVAVVGSLTADEKAGGPNAKDFNGWFVLGMIWPVVAGGWALIGFFKGLRWLLNKFADAADEARVEYLGRR